ILPLAFGLCERGNSLNFLKKLNKNHSPVNAILVSAGLVAICIVINKIMPERALEVLMSLVVSSLVINWTMISLTHIFFKRKITERLETSSFPTLFYPISNYISLFFLLGVLVMMWFTGLKISVELIPIWLLLLYITYRLVQRNKRLR